MRKGVVPSLILGCVIAALVPGVGRAERIRYHYVPAPGCDGVQLGPSNSGGVGDRLSWVGRTPQAYNLPPHPNQCVCFADPATGKYVRVPLELPPDVPRIEHVYLGTNYNYGSYAVEIRFLADGSVDVTYNNGLLRRAYP